VTMMVDVFYFLYTPGVSGKVGSLIDSHPLVTLVGCKRQQMGAGRSERKRAKRGGDRSTVALSKQTVALGLFPVSPSTEHFLDYFL